MTTPDSADDVANQLAALHAVMEGLAQSDTVDQAFSTLLPAICRGTGWDVGAAWLLDRAANVLRCVAFWASPGLDTLAFGDSTRATTFAPGVGLPGRVWSSKVACRISDVVIDPNFPRAPQAAHDGLHGAFGLPITDGEEVLGVLEFLSREVRVTSPSVLRTMDAIGGQIGLFVQRAQVRQEVRIADARKAAILEAALDCVITIDQTGTIIELNPAVERVFGRPCSQLIGTDLADAIIPPSLRAAHRAGLAHCLATGEGPVLGRRLELTAIRANGQEFPVELVVKQIRSEGAPMFTGYLRDLTEIHRTESEVRQAERRLKAVLGCTRGVVFEVDLQGRYVNVWTSDESLLSRPRSDVTGRTLVEVLGSDPSKQFVERLARIHATGHAETFECALETMGGKTSFLVDGFVTPEEPGGTATVVFHARDNSEQVALRDRLQGLTRRLVATQEAERRHIARELHDELGQVLSGLNLTLETAVRLPHQAGLARIAEAQQLIHELIERVRALSLDLRPAVLEEGLVPALEVCLERNAEHLAIRFEHATLAGRRFSPEIETAVYRIVQEALTNVTRHALAQHVIVLLELDGEWLHVYIEDDGVGFDPDTTPRDRGGLVGMSERATLLGGVLQIDSSRGRGTGLRAELPLADHSARS